MKKTLNFAFFVIMSSLIPNISAMSNDGDTEANKDSQYAIERTQQIKKERRIANVFDAALTTVIAKVFQDCITQNPTLSAVSVGSAFGYGVGGWLSGEFLEMIYKKVYKVVTGKNLREAMGTTVICGIEIDNQRLLRRIITLTGVC